MTLTRDFKETVQARVRREPAFARALFTEGIQLLIEGDVAAGRLVLRDYINATVGFREACGGDQDIAQEPDAHVRRKRQSDRQQSLRGDLRAASQDGHGDRSAGEQEGGLGGEVADLLRKQTKGKRPAVARLRNHSVILTVSANPEPGESVTFRRAPERDSAFPPLQTRGQH